MALDYQTVTIPITKGIDVTGENILLDPPKLMEAVNCRFIGGEGSTKRRGHDVITARAEKAIPPGWAPTDDLWLYGWGYQNPSNPLTYDNGYSPSALLDTSPHPAAGRLYGLAQRDQEAVVWTGYSLLSYGQNGVTQTFADSGTAVMPSLYHQPIAKTAGSQVRPDVADNGVIKVVAWLDSSTTKIRYSVYNSVTAAPFNTYALLDAVTPYQVRCVPLGRWVHMLVADTNGNTLQCYTLDQDSPGTVPVKRSMGACNSHFDVWKVSEAEAAIVKANNTTNTIDVIFLNADGSPNLGTSQAYNFTINPATGVPVGADCVAIAVHPTTGRIGLAWQIQDGGLTPDHYFGAVTRTGTVIGFAGNLGSTGRSKHISLAPQYLTKITGDEVFDVFWDADSPTGGICYAQRTAFDDPGEGITAPRILGNHLLASQAFRVGNRTFIWTGHKALLQSTWVLVDETLRPVGKQDYIIAAVDSYATTSSHLSSMNWITDSAVPDKNRTKFHYALGFNTRGPTTSTQTGVFAESQITAGTIEFLPKLHSAQAGRALYFAGAQVNEYDGASVVEQGFHYGPELSTPVQSAGGTLTALGTYFYRVDLCHKNSQGEEVRSISVLTPVTTLTAGNQTITFSIPTCVTRRPDSYFLVFRNAMIAGIPTVNMWLLNSRDPAVTGNYGFRLNDNNVNSITFTDIGTVTDTAIQTRELHPAGAGGDTYLQPTSAPACEIIGSGQDRLWVAGGELLPGQVAPSRLFQPGDQPTFNAYLQIQVDRGAEPITAIGFVGEIAAIFRRNSTYILDSAGPDNSTNGVWAPCRLAIADLGAVGQEGIALISSGLVFQSPTGFRLLGPGGGVSPLGEPVDSLARPFVVRSTVVVNTDQEVRWYGETGTFVYNYLYDNWSTWDVTAVGAIRDNTTGYALIANQDGRFWRESTDKHLDGDRPYNHRIRFPWLHAGSIGDFQRVRKIGCLGNYVGPHTIKIELYYDEQDWPNEVFQWDVPDVSVDNNDTWGGEPRVSGFYEPGYYIGGFFAGASPEWGDGVWGDNNSDLPNTIHDNDWDWVRRPNRQKCAVISVAVEDVQTDGPGFVLTALCLELGKKKGLNKLPARNSGSDNYR